MPIASRLKWFLDVNRADYEVVHPSPSDALQGEVPPERLVVSEIFQDAKGYLMVVHPATRRTTLSALRELVGRPLHRARKSALRNIFFDCEGDAVPPVGAAYGVPTVLDDSVPRDGDLYFRCGDEGDLVHMKGAAFLGLADEGSQHGNVSRAN